MTLKEQMERIWNRPRCENPSHFNKWSLRFYDGHGNQILGSIKGRKARQKNPNKLGKISSRPKKEA